jgi:hypothetical protein
MPAVPATVTKDDLKERIRNERRVELAFEKDNYYAYLV